MLRLLRIRWIIIGKKEGTKACHGSEFGFEFNMKGEH
jgi:hypothetical protein